MKHEKKARSLVRKMLRDVRSDPHIMVLVFDESLVHHHHTTEKAIIDQVFSCDETQVKFLDIATGRIKGVVSFVLDYDAQPLEIINDYSDTKYMNNLMQRLGLGG